MQATSLKLRRDASGKLVRPQFHEDFSTEDAAHSDMASSSASASAMPDLTSPTPDPTSSTPPSLSWASSPLASASSSSFALDAVPMPMPMPSSRIGEPSAVAPSTVNTTSSVDGARPTIYQVYAAEPLPGRSGPAATTMRRVPERQESESRFRRSIASFLRKDGSIARNSETYSGGQCVPRSAIRATRNVEWGSAPPRHDQGTIAVAVGRETRKKTPKDGEIRSMMRRMWGYLRGNRRVGYTVGYEDGVRPMVDGVGRGLSESGDDGLRVRYIVTSDSDNSSDEQEDEHEAGPSSQAAAAGP